MVYKIPEGFRTEAQTVFTTAGAFDLGRRVSTTSLYGGLVNSATKLSSVAWYGCRSVTMSS